ncbi:MAG: SWIM zinc finger family protein [Spirochaetales bacterium]|nr:SWIM zinc finger family protein [Spirochaetales bacterium]
MAIIKFGHTWWGENWLNALDNIDFENRLPRGERYARNGSVRDIAIMGNTIQAKVKGRESRPYSVKLKTWSFSAKEKKIITHTVNNSPYYLSQLEARILPAELSEDLDSQGIKLFPKSWEDLGMNCSCPDWAVPCKHLAAVTYLIANEIDKNPFLIFELHGFDLLGEIKKDKAAEEDIFSISSLVLPQAREYSYYQEKLEHIDFSLVNDLEDSMDKLLTDHPLFYPQGDFKSIMLDVQKRFKKSISAHIRDLEILEIPPKQSYTIAEINIHKGKCDFKGELRKGKNKLVFSSEDMAPLVEYLHFLSAGDLDSYPPVLSFLVMVHVFTLRLIEQNALIPEIYGLKENSYAIRWIPALFSQEVREIFINLEQALPRAIVSYGQVPLADKEQVLFLISFFHQYYIQLLDPIKTQASDSMVNLFYRNTAYTPVKFEERENAKTIHLWLGRFFLRPIDHYPIIAISEAGPGRFDFDMKIGNRKTEDELPLSFPDFMKGDEKDKMGLLRDLSLLATYLPVVNLFLKNQGRMMTLAAENFVQQWFKALPVFKTLGIKTLLPKVLQNIFIPQLTLKATAVKSDQSVSYINLEQLLQFNWTVALGNQHVSPEELVSLSQKYKGLVRFKDKYVIIDDQELENIIQKSQKEIKMSPLDILKINLTQEFEDVPIESDEKTRDLFKSLFIAKEVEVPEQITAKLRHYQTEGFKWLYHNYCCGLGSLIADDMGLGKTLQVITFLQKLANDGELNMKSFDKKALIIVPASLATNWEREIMKFAPELHPIIYHGSGRKLAVDSDVIITTYGLVRSDPEAFKNKKWKVIILDEAQNIKNPQSEQTRSVKQLKSDYKIAMTGTPVENKLLDYWSILDFVLKNLLGNKTSFKKDYAAPIERYRNQKVLKKFKALTEPFILRRLKSDKSIINDLPEKNVMNQFPSLTKKQAVLYKEYITMIETIPEDAGEISRSGIIFKLINGLKQICCHPSLFLKNDDSDPEKSGKAQYLLDLLLKIREGSEKVLIFTQFAEMGHLLVDMIKKELDIEPPFLYGATARKKRDELVDSFQSDKDTWIMVISIKAGGVGLNLTAANHIVHYDLWWNPAVENQATDRAFRIGQKKNVNVYRLITKGTFEEKINDMIERKKELADLTVNVGEKWIGRMSNKDLRELVSLTD